MVAEIFAVRTRKYGDFFFQNSPNFVPHKYVSRGIHFETVRLYEIAILTPWQPKKVRSFVHIWLNRMGF